MARRRSRIKTVPDAARRKDFISQLPADLKDRIMECLSTRDAARTALLSTHWNDVWLRHGRLVFDSDFFECAKNYKVDKSITVTDIINNILFLHVGPVKKFTLDINYFCPDLRVQQSELDRWCLFLSRNRVEELNLSICYPGNYFYNLPFSIFTCPTLKKLKLGGFSIGFPVNARCIFPSVTTLVFYRDQFKRGVNGLVFSLPKLEKLAFNDCTYFMKNFDISAPNLRSLSASGFIYGAEFRWFTLHLEAIKALYLSAYLLETSILAKAVSKFPMAINLQTIKLYDLKLYCGRQFICVMNLLEKSPNLCKLEIFGAQVKRRCRTEDRSVASRILKDPDNYVINQNVKMLNTLKIELFIGSKLEMIFVKAMLSKSPALEKVVIRESARMDTAMASEIQRELLCSPRASPKAQLVFLEHKPNYSLVGYPKFFEFWSV